MTEHLSTIILELAEWDWVNKNGGRALHHLAAADDPASFEQDCGGSGVTSCGLRAEWWLIPGIFSRSGSPRCRICCKALGYPQGTGSPKNDMRCRGLVEARLIPQICPEEGQ